tara:strand:- start:3402 stop:4400 length:999 start_codon:yes stop_codon:yes gene_type:complete
MRRPVRIPKKVDLNRVEAYADKVMDPVDVEFTNHFFDQLTRSEHKKEITNAELIGFFKRLSKKKKQFDKFMQQYDEFVAKDKRTDINIPFKSNVDQIIAKTIMRKKDFKTSNAEYKFENYKYNMKHIKIYEQFVNEDVNESIFKKGDKVRVKASAMSKFKTDRQGFNNTSNPIFTVVSGPKRGYISARRAGKLSDLPVDDVELLPVNESSKGEELSEFNKKLYLKYNDKLTNSLSKFFSKNSISKASNGTYTYNGSWQSIGNSNRSGTQLSEMYNNIKNMFFRLAWTFKEYPVKQKQYIDILKNAGLEIVEISNAHTNKGLTSNFNITFKFK